MRLQFEPRFEENSLNLQLVALDNVHNSHEGSCHFPSYGLCVKVNINSSTLGLTEPCCLLNARVDANNVGQE
jgi:hypothetical protein